jgi:hypothetical protein
MFKFSAYGRRVGRTAFGAVLIVGMGVLVRRLAIDVERAGSAYLIPATWAAAFAAYAITGWLGSRRTLDHADELAAGSLAVPAAGVALILPLTLHLLVGLALTRDLAAFDVWAAASAILTGPTHLAFAVLVARRARQLAAGAPAMPPNRIYGICVAVSCLPFAVIVLPPIFVMVTGLPILPLLHWMESLAARDRDRGAAEALPRAIAVASLPRAA